MIWTRTEGLGRWKKRCINKYILEAVKAEKRSRIDGRLFA